MALGVKQDGQGGKGVFSSVELQNHFEWTSNCEMANECA